MSDTRYKIRLIMPIHVYDIRTIDRLRMERGWSVVELAERAGIEWSTIYRAMRGECLLSERSASAIARALEIPLRQIVVDSGSCQSAEAVA